MKVCNKQDFFEWIKVTEAHPNKYYFERIDVFDNALVVYSENAPKDYKISDRAQKQYGLLMDILELCDIYY